MSNKYSGMTVVERLYVSGHLSAYEMAVEEKDVEKIIAILQSVELDDDNINAILSHLGITPRQ